MLLAVPSGRIDRRGTADHAPADFTDRSVAARYHHDIAGFLQGLLPLCFFGRLIIDLVPGGAKQFNQIITRTPRTVARRGIMDESDFDVLFSFVERVGSG